MRKDGVNLEVALEVDELLGSSSEYNKRAYSPNTSVIL